MHDIKSRELREKDPNANTMIVSRYEPSLYVPVFTQKDFNYPLRIFQKGISTEELHRLQIRSTQLQLSHLYTRGKAKSQYKVKKEIQLSDHKNHKQYLVISKDHKQNTSHNTKS